jgi:hypothetical protein
LNACGIGSSAGTGTSRTGGGGGGGIIDCIAEGPACGANGGNGVDGGSSNTLPARVGGGAGSSRTGGTNAGSSITGGTNAGSSRTGGTNAGSSRTGGTNADSAGASWNFSIVTPDGEKYRNPTNPITNNPAITNNILNFFAILYL